MSSNLTSINSAGNAILRVDSTPQVSGNRNSVRIQTQYSFTGGLVIMDSVHMPAGCGTWPAFWTNGPTWPQTGEIDIVEGVNNYTNNQATVHAGNGCQLPTTNVTSLGISGSVVGGTNCAALETNNEGCGMRASQTNSFGAPFNQNGGGVFASTFLFCKSPLINTYRALLMDTLPWQCFGTTRVSPFTSSLGRTYHRTSPLRRPFLIIGARQAHSGLQAAAIRSSFSKTTVPSSILPYAAIGLGVCGQRLAFQAKIRVVRSERVSRPASSSCSRMARHFPKHVCPLFFFPLCILCLILIGIDWEVKGVQIYQSK